MVPFIHQLLHLGEHKNITDLLEYMQYDMETCVIVYSIRSCAVFAHGIPIECMCADKSNN